MVRRSLRIWICTQSLDFFLGQTIDACDLPVFRMNTSYGRYGAAYSMVGFSCFNDKLPCV